MRVRCPVCGTSLSLDALLAHEGARDAVLAAFAVSGPLGSALLQYLGLFRPEVRDLTLDRVAKLLRELLPDLQAGRIEHDGRVYEAPPAAWIWAIEQAMQARAAERLRLPLRSHNWLYTVITTWRPAESCQLVTAVPRSNSAVTSRTAGAIAALEDRARG